MLKTGESKSRVRLTGDVDVVTLKLISLEVGVAVVGPAQPRGFPAILIYNQLIIIIRGAAPNIDHTQIYVYAMCMCVCSMPFMQVGEF